MRVAYLITGRLKSTRLPKKLLIEVEGKTILNHLIDRIKLAKNVNEIILCTSNKTQDKPLKAIAEKNNIKCYFGDPDDVLVRLLGAAEEFNIDYILNITADCPFADPEYADRIYEEFLKTDADLIRQFDLPHGVFSYGIKVDALRKVVEIKDTSDTEVWGRYFTDTGQFNVVDLKVINKHHIRPGLRMTLDYPEDLKFFEKIFEALYKKNRVFSLTDILNFLDENPEIIEINRECGAKFNKRFYSQSEPKFKKNSIVNKAIIIGSGSIGQRHITNLKKIGINDITALRSKKGHYKEIPNELGVFEVFDWNEVLVNKYDIAIISNPSSLHVEAAEKISKNVNGIFIEKPLSNDLSEAKKLVKILNANKVTSFVGHNLMFHPIINQIKDFYNQNDLGEIINIQCQVGQWLPDWHPYENYKEAYYSRKDLGGGVSLSLIHEIHLVLKLAGLPLHVFGEFSPHKKLDINVDVCSDLMIKHDSGAISQVHLDFVQRATHRSGLITFEKAWLSYDFNKMEITAQRLNEKPFQLFKNTNYDSNEMYINQMQKFISLVEEGRMKHDDDSNSALESLKVVDALFNSNNSGKKEFIERDEKFSF